MESSIESAHKTKSPISTVIKLSCILKSSCAHLTVLKEKLVIGDLFRKDVKSSLTVQRNIIHVLRL